MNLYNWQRLAALNLEFWKCLRSKTSKGNETEALKSDAEYQTENHQIPQYADILDVT